MKRIIIPAVAIVLAVVACDLPSAATPTPPDLPADLDVDVSLGLVAHYPLDGTADDSGGSALHGQSLNAAASIDHLGQQGGALLFNGVDSLVTIPDDDLLDLDGDFSISFFIKGNSASDHEWLILTKHLAGVCQPADTSWMLRCSRDYGLRLVNYDTTVDCGKTILSTADVDLLDDAWHHIVIVHDADAARIALYLDAALVVESDAATLNIQNNDVALIIGNQSNGVPQHTLDAAIDDLRIYDRAIGEDVIRALYGGTN